MPHFWSCVGALLLTAAIAGCADYRRTGHSPDTFRAVNLVREFEMSGDAANIWFADRAVRVIGKVAQTGSSRRGVPFVRFEPEPGSRFTVLAFVTGPGGLASVRAGTDASVTCDSLERRFNIVLRGCRVSASD